MTRFVDHYGDGAFYDAEYIHIRNDLGLYQQLAREAGGSVLELACGTGRLSFPMAEAGAYVVGVDNSEAMLARARSELAKRGPPYIERVRFELGDMRTIRLAQRFDRVVLGFNALLHMLEDEDVLKALATVKAHLKPGGLFHFDMYSPAENFVNRHPSERFEPQQMIHPETGERWIVTENNRYDFRMQLNHMYFYYRRADEDGAPFGEEHCAEVILRVLYPRELDALLRRAGFEIEAEFEDYARAKPFTGEVGLRVVTARVAQETRNVGIDPGVNE